MVGPAVVGARSCPHATCEGLAALELRGALTSATDPREIWMGGLAALVKGWAPAHASDPPRAADRIPSFLSPSMKPAPL